MSHVSNYNILDDTKCPNFRIIIVERMCKVLSERLIHDSIKIRQEMNVINLITNESNPEQILYNGKNGNWCLPNTLLLPLSYNYYDC